MFEKVKFLGQLLAQSVDQTAEDLAESFIPSTAEGLPPTRKINPTTGNRMINKRVDSEGFRFGE